jgi:hypothetical protein
MNAGAINISVAATMTRFNESMTAVKTTAATKGGEAGKAFKDSFDKQGEGLGANYAKQLQNSIRGAIAVGAISQAMKVAIEEGARGANFTDALAAAIKSVPVIGAFASLAEAMMDYAIGTSAAEAAREASRVMEAEAQKSLAVAEGRAKRLVAAEFELRRNAAREAGDERLAIDLEAQEKLAALEKQFKEESLAATRDSERKFLAEIFQAERQLIQQSAAARIRAIDEAAERQKQADEERIRKEAEKQAREDEARREKQLDLLKQELAEVESQRQAMSGAVGSISTAIGEFRFAAYSDNEKKQNDQALLAQVRQINAKAAALGGFI